MIVDSWQFVIGKSQITNTESQTNHNTRRTRRVTLSLFYKKIEYLPSTFDIRYSLFDIRFLKFLLSIKPAVSQASGPPEAEHLTSETFCRISTVGKLLGAEQLDFIIRSRLLLRFGRRGVGGGR